MVLGGEHPGVLARYLQNDGWSVTEVADTEAKAPGIDLLATKAERWRRLK